MQTMECKSNEPGSKNSKSRAKQEKAKYHRLIWLLIFLSVAAAIGAICIGRYMISVREVVRVLINEIIPLTPDWNQKAPSVILNLRLPRIIGAYLVGGALAISGAAYQGVFKNPLVSPDLLGISSGACVGASLAILMGLNYFSIQLSAFVWGILTVFLTTLLPRILKNNSMTTLVLSGVIVSGIMNSIMGIIKYVADPETQLAAITYWQLGSITKVMRADVLAVAPMIVIATVVLLLLRWKINLLSLGETEARTLGVDTEKLKRVIIVCATMLTACSVCLCGTIGWVGLVIPHLSRMFAGPDNSRSLPVSFALGGLFMLVIDTVARAATSVEIPLSVLTGLIGAPFYFYVLSKQRMKLS